MACELSLGSLDQPDSLEGWVAVKEDPFACNVIPPRLLFLVSWNDVERKIAITVRLRNRVVSDTQEHHGRSGLFSFQELRGIHDLLSLVHPSLSPQLPELPEEPRGVWAFVSYQETPENIDEICEHLQTVYFPIALEVCKEQLLMSTMFEEHGHDEYFENISELRRQGYDQAIRLAEEELKNVLFERENVSGMVEMADVYRREDEAVFKLNIALAELYNYQIQPFLDVREVSCMRVREAKREIQNPDIGERVKREYCNQLMEWQQHYEEALDMIQENYMKYYAKTRSIFQGILTRLEEDKKRFGPTSFALVAEERMYRVKEDMILQNLQYLNNKRKKYVQERDKVKETIASMDEQPGVRRELANLENQVFEWQQKIYDLHLDTLAAEEKLIKTQREAITRDIQDKQEQMVFYDAVENVDDLSDPDLDEDMPSLMITDPSLKVIRDKLKVIQTKRAKLRTKKVVGHYLRNRLTHSALEN